MTAPRRVGAETSKTRLRLLDSVERLMVKTGYAGVTYRAVAAEAGVTAGLVQYYFPTLDDVFVAAIRRRAEENLGCLAASLQSRPAEPLRVLWEYSRDEAAAALTTEFLAVGNHRPSIQSEIAESIDRVRQLQLNALHDRFGTEPIAGSAGIVGTELSADALLFLLTGIPKLVRLEAGVGVSRAHREVMSACESFLDAVEPQAVESQAAESQPAGPPATSTKRKR